MKKIIILTIILFSICCDRSQAQLYQDAGGIAITMHSKSEIEKLSNGNPLKGRKFSFTTYDVWVPVPNFKVGKAEVFSTLSYQLVDINYDQNNSIDESRPNKIHEIKSAVFIKYPISNSWSVSSLAMPSLASDFKGTISNEDFILQGALVATKKLKVASHLEIGLGVFATYVFGEQQFIPAFSIDYESDNGKWIGQAYWPKFSMFYNINSNSQVGFAASIDGTEYNLKNFVNQYNETIDNADFSVIHIGPQYNRRVYKDFWLQLQAGLAMGNQYKLFNSQNKLVTEGDYSLKDMTYGKFMLTYRFDAKKGN